MYLDFFPNDFSVYLYGSINHFSTQYKQKGSWSFPISVNKKEENAKNASKTDLEIQSQYSKICGLNTTGIITIPVCRVTGYEVVY